MATLTPKRIRGRTYYYLRECRRVNGRPKIVWQKYVGSATDVAAILEDRDALRAPLPEAPVLELGASATLLDLARRLGLPDLLDAQVPKRGPGPGVGTYLLLIILNRCIAPRSKAALADWYAGTSLARLLPLDPAQLTPQRFWDNMDRVSEEDLRALEAEITRRVVRAYDLDLGCLFYDATNFFTFVDSFNARPALPQRGHSKEGRANLRILGLALLVTSTHRIPLFHHLYPGNQPDAPTLRSLLDDLVARHHLLAGEGGDVTLVFDKGNNAQDILQDLARSPYHVIGSLVPTQHPDLLALRKEEMRALDPERFPDGVYAHRTTKEVYGREYTVLVTFNQNLYDAQRKTLEREIAKRRARLHALQSRLRRSASSPRRGKKPTVASTRRAVERVLTGRHMKDLFEVQVEGGRGQPPRLTNRFDDHAFGELERTLLGKTLLFTDHADWTDEALVTGYRGQFHVESAFRQMKDPHYLSFRPVYHWTDQKIRVHAFCCVMALTLCSILNLEIERKGVVLSVDRMLDHLTSIREVQVLTKSSRGRLRTDRITSQLDPTARRLHDILEVGRHL